MKNKEQLFTLDELASLVDLPRRTVRYYIQIALIDRPAGVGRGAHYSARHLEQLIEIRKWQEAGLSLERIRELVITPESGKVLPPLKPSQPGTVEVRSHIVVSDGVELTIDPKRSGLSPEHLREFASGVIALFDQIGTNKEKKS